MWIKWLTYATLWLAVVALWIPSTNQFKPWKVLLSIVLVLSFFSGITNLVALCSIVLFYILVSLYYGSSTNWRYVLWMTVLIMAIALELHYVPGFNNLLVLDRVQFTTDVIPYTL